jgi:hypothetical protein
MQLEIGELYTGYFSAGRLPLTFRVIQINELGWIQAKVFSNKLGGGYEAIEELVNINHFCEIKKASELERIVFKNTQE